LLIIVSIIDPINISVNGGPSEQNWFKPCRYLIAWCGCCSWRGRVWSWVVSGSGRVCIWLLWLWNFVFLLLEYKLMDSSFLILFLIALIEVPYGALKCRWRHGSTCKPFMWG
jgi:hypothetical protein